MDVPLAIVYALSLLLLADRVLVPGAAMSGLIRLLPSAVTGPRLLNTAIVSVPVFNAPGANANAVKELITVIMPEDGKQAQVG